MKEGKPNRREVLKKAGVGSVAMLTGVTGSAAAKQTESTYEFNPHNLPEVRDFIEQNVVKSRTNIEGQPDEVRFADSINNLDKLSEKQREALVDGVEPSVSRSITLDTSSSMSVSSLGEAEPSVDVDFVGEDLLDKWNWSMPQHLTKVDSSTMNEMVSTDGSVSIQSSTETFTHTQDQVAISIDYTAWRWQCRIDWEYNSSEILNSNHSDKVKYTNYAIEHRGTETEEIGIADDEYEILFETHFHNNNLKVCDPTGSVCLDLSSNFYPHQQLKGDTNGNGTLVSNSTDAW